ncbi:MAG: hypothetical protein AABZ80_04105 [Gemmatimonadota bacterium]
MNGTSIYGTRAGYGTCAGPVAPRAWGATTQRGDTVFVHLLGWPDRTLALPDFGAQVVSANMFSDGSRVDVAQTAAGIALTMPMGPSESLDRVVVPRVVRR